MAGRVSLVVRNFRCVWRRGKRRGTGLTGHGDEEEEVGEREEEMLDGGHFLRGLGGGGARVRGQVKDGGRGAGWASRDRVMAELVAEALRHFARGLFVE